MATILVETRGELRCNPILDAMAAVCNAQGHRVVRWRGPLSGRIPVSRQLVPCDLAILFNGTHARYERSVAKLRRRGTPVLFVELGWCPQSQTLQVDAQGINAGAGWVNRPLESVGQKRLAVQGRDLLLTLQHDKDTQIGSHSPWFRNMAEFVAHVVKNSKLPVRIRRHPLHEMDGRIRRLADQFNCTWDAAPTFAAALEHCRAVACVNSSSAVEALARRLPVLCYGQAIYRHSGAVYCLTNDSRLTAQTTGQLALGECSLFEERIDEVLQRIFDHQWRVDELAAKLPDLLADLLNAQPTKLSSSHSWRRLIRVPYLARLLAGTRSMPQGQLGRATAWPPSSASAESTA